MKSSLHFPSFIALLLPVVGIWLTSSKLFHAKDSPKGNQVVEHAEYAPARTKSTGDRSAPRAAGALNADGVVMIRPDEWQARFRTDYQDVDPEIRSEVVLLAGELRDLIDQGLDPKGEEAHNFGETILVLLNEKTAR